MILLLSFWCLAPTVAPWPLIWIGRPVMMMWSRSGAQDRFGPLWYAKFMPVGQWADLVGLYPAYLAIYGMILATLLYAGVGHAEDWFPCWQTTKPSWYDFLG